MLVSIAIFSLSLGLTAAAQVESVIPRSDLAINSIPFSTRAHWMRMANRAAAPCTIGAFGTVIVDHNAPGLGQLVCMGANAKNAQGNPTLHAEISAIQNCSRIFMDPTGSYRMTAAEALVAFTQLSLYTNAESCPMCASAIRWTGFREYIYGTSLDTLIAFGWVQIRIPSIQVFKQSFDLPNAGRLLGEVLINETDGMFSWQFNPSAQCPAGCARSEDGDSCIPSQ